MARGAMQVVKWPENRALITVLAESIKAVAATTQVQASRQRQIAGKPPAAKVGFRGQYQGRNKSVRDLSGFNSYVTAILGRAGLRGGAAV